MSPEDLEAVEKSSAPSKWAFDPSGTGTFPPGIRVFRSASVLGEMSVHSGGISDGMLLRCGAGAAEAFPEAYETIAGVLRDAFEVRNIRHNTMIFRHELSVKGFIGNLGKAAQYPFIQKAGPVLADIPVFVVSAGPSLDKNGHLLKECRKRGLVFAMHSSAGAVRHHGAGVDLLVCIEGMDTSGFVKDLPNVQQAALCLSAHSGNYSTPFKKYIFCSGHPAFAHAADKIGGKWFHYGSSVATACLSLARVLGSKTLVMVGQDLSYPGGRVYATGTGREHVTVDITAETITRSDIAEQTARYKSHGLKLAEAPRPRVNVPAWGGSGEVATTADMVAFLRWLEAFGSSDPSIRFVNATEGGAHVEHTEESTLEEVLQTLPEIDIAWERALGSLEPIPAGTMASYISSQRMTAKNIIRKAEVALASCGRGGEDVAQMALEALMSMAPMVAQLAGPVLATAREDRSMSPVQYARVALPAIRKAAKEYMGML